MEAAGVVVFPAAGKHGPPSPGQVVRLFQAKQLVRAVTEDTVAVQRWMPEAPVQVAAAYAAAGIVVGFTDGLHAPGQANQKSANRCDRQGRSWQARLCDGGPGAGREGGYLCGVWGFQPMTSNNAKKPTR